MASYSEPARPGPGVRLCALEDLADPGAKGFRFKANARMFMGFVLRRGSTVTGFEDSCPHAGWPLASADAYLTRAKDRILCAGHGAFFDLDGLCVSGPCEGERLEPWPVAVIDGQVFTA